MVREKSDRDRGLVQVTLRQIKEHELKVLAEKVIAAAEHVWQELGPGHSEAIYQKAMEIETRSLDSKPLQICPVVYKGVTVGHHVPDLICADAVIELKVAQTISKLHLAQLGAYLRLLDLPLGILINFPSCLDEKLAIQLLLYHKILTV